MSLFINKILHTIHLRIYEDNSVETLIIGNDKSDLNFLNNVKNETINHIRPLRNKEDKNIRCHIHLS